MGKLNPSKSPFLQGRLKKMKNKKMKQNKGQIAIIVLLASAIILTLGLSASKKAVIDTKVDTDEQLLKEAFNAAESGINSYINDGSSTYETGNGAKASVDSVTIGGGTIIASEGPVLANNNQLFWLVDHESNGDIGVNYYESTPLHLTVDSNFNGSLKIDYFYKNGSVYGVTHIGYNFSSPGAVDGYTDSSTKTIDIPNTGDSLLLVVTPLVSSTNISLSGSSNFPDQGEELTAIGTAGDGVKTQIRTRNIYQIPSFFMEAITAGNIIE